MPNDLTLSEEVLVFIEGLDARDSGLTPNDLARQVAAAANAVLHQEPTKLSNARDVLIKLRGVLEYIYS